MYHKIKIELYINTTSKNNVSKAPLAQMTNSQVNMSPAKRKSLHADDYIPSKIMSPIKSRSQISIPKIAKDEKKPRLNPQPNLIGRKVNSRTEDSTSHNSSTETVDSLTINIENDLLKSPIKQIINQGTDKPTTSTTTDPIQKPRFFHNNRFSVLENIIDKESVESKNTSIFEELRRKNEIARGQRKTTSPSGSQSNPKTRESSDPASVPSGEDTSSPLEVVKETPARAKRLDRPPPINIIRQDPKDTASLIEDQLKTKDFYIKRINSGKHILYLQKLSDYNNAKTLLHATNTVFYTYTPAIEKPQTYLIKGLNNTFDSNEILAELNSLNTPQVNFTKVTQFKTKNSTAKEISLPIFLVQISADSIANNLFKIKYIKHQVIKWEKLKKKEVTQCFNCQLIGHTAQNCFMDFRCVKCSESHEPGECKINKNEKIEKDKIYCANCKNYGHPASYRGCPILIALRNKLREKVNKSREASNPKTSIIAKRYSPNLSFSNAVKNNLGTTASQQDNTENNPETKLNAIPNHTTANAHDITDSPPSDITKIFASFNMIMTNAIKQLQVHLQSQLDEIKIETRKNAERIDSLCSNIANYSP